MNLQIISDQLLDKYLRNFPDGVFDAFSRLKEAEISTENFSFYTSVSSVFSSKIEGEDIELDSFIKHKKLGMKFLPDFTQKIDDLYEAYVFAQENRMTIQNISEAHILLSKNFVAEQWRGKFRIQSMFVSTPDGKIEYVAASPFSLEKEMFKLYADLQRLLDAQLSFEEVFYYASYLHLIFVKIHPWIDGNGRTARLLEKWFIAEKLGEKAWFLESEKMYYEKHDSYYQNLRNLGLEYENLNYDHALPFLNMLPTVLSTKQ